jgi:hypothetical protein
MTTLINETEEGPEDVFARIIDHIAGENQTLLLKLIGLDHCTIVPHPHD